MSSALRNASGPFAANRSRGRSQPGRSLIRKWDSFSKAPEFVASPFGIQFRKIPARPTMAINANQATVQPFVAYATKGCRQISRAVEGMSWTRRLEVGLDLTGQLPNNLFADRKRSCCCRARRIEDVQRMPPLH